MVAFKVGVMTRGRGLQVNKGVGQGCTIQSIADRVDSMLIAMSIIIEML